MDSFAKGYNDYLQNPLQVSINIYIYVSITRFFERKIIILYKRKFWPEPSARMTMCSLPSPVLLYAKEIHDRLRKQNNEPLLI